MCTSRRSKIIIKKNENKKNVEFLTNELHEITTVWNRLNICDNIFSYCGQYLHINKRFIRRLGVPNSS